jgi:hypothetical protein
MRPFISADGSDPSTKLNLLLAAHRGTSHIAPDTRFYIYLCILYRTLILFHIEKLLRQKFMSTQAFLSFLYKLILLDIITIFL